MKKILLLLLACLPLASWSQDNYPKNPYADILSYTFELVLNDSSNHIRGEATIVAHLQPEAKELILDLVGATGNYGMKVNEVLENTRPVEYTFEQDRIRITPDNVGEEDRIYTVTYEGIAEKGLVIDTTKFGQRSFFGDNWPNLARHWLPSVDHPYDKAAVAFRIIAPAHYDVVATGRKIEESYLEKGYKLTHYLEPAPVATKNMTIGVTRFASMTLGFVGDTEVSAWVYPENRLEGFNDYAVAVRVLDYFEKNIGPYPWAKLANMQAKTQWGGLENAGTISYRESSVTGKNEVEDLIAHEVAHQWFGNSASEANWNHVWLSEGFATYFTVLYLENRYGEARRKQLLLEDRKQVMDYYRTQPGAVVDTTISDPMRVLSTNTYQKGGWVLHMLRHQLGEDVFWEGIRTYYDRFAQRNALTEDFQAIMEEVSGLDLSGFFHQWLYVPGFPELTYNWKYKKGRIELTIEQKQQHHTYSFPLEIGIRNGEEYDIRTVQVSERKQSFTLEADSAPDKIIPDPEVWLLFSESR